MARTVHIYEYDPKEGSAFTKAITARARLKDKIARAGNPETKIRRVADGTRTVNIGGEPIAIEKFKDEEYTVNSFPSGTTVDQVAAKLYPEAPGAGAKLIKQNNALSRVEGILGQGLAANQWIRCPDYVTPLNDTSDSADTPAEEQSFFDWREALGGIAQIYQSGLRPRYIEAQMKILKKYSDMEVAIVVFYAETALSDPGDSGKYEVIRDAVSISCRDSLFEGARVFKFKMPFDENLPDSKAHRYGNHIAVSIKGVPIFMGLLINPKVGRGSGRTIEWTCMSHSFRLIKSHFNPMAFQTEWRDMTPLEVISRVANAHEHPMWIGKSEQKAMLVPYEDEDGLRNLGNDIRTSTPFKFMQKLVNAAGLFLHPSVDGFLVVQSVDVGAPPNILITESDATLEGVSTVSGLYTVEYNFDDLAGNYMVMDQKRDADGAQMLQLRPFPIGCMFRNLVRDEAAPLVLDRVSSIVGLGEEKTYPKYESADVQQLADAQIARDQKARERKKSLGATIFEVSKAMANAIKIKITVPGWISPTGTPWETSTPVYVVSELYNLSLNRAIITSVDFRATNKARTTILSCTLAGRFDAVIPSNIPFMFDRNQEMTYVAKEYDQLLDESKSSQDVETE